MSGPVHEPAVRALVLPDRGSWRGISKSRFLDIHREWLDHRCRQRTLHSLATARPLACDQRHNDGGGSSHCRQIGCERYWREQGTAGIVNGNVVILSIIVRAKWSVAAGGSLDYSLPSRHAGAWIIRRKSR